MEASVLVYATGSSQLVANMRGRLGQAEVCPNLPPRVDDYEG